MICLSKLTEVWMPNYTLKLHGSLWFDDVFIIHQLISIHSARRISSSMADSGVLQVIYSKSILAEQRLHRILPPKKRE